MAEAVTRIEQAEEVPSLSELAAAVGYAPHHFQRIFKRDLGVSPAEYARGLRNRRTETALKANGRDASQLSFVETRLRRADQEPIPGPIGRGRPNCPA